MAITEKPLIDHITAKTASASSETMLKSVEQYQKIDYDMAVLNTFIGMYVRPKLWHRFIGFFKKKFEY